VPGEDRIVPSDGTVPIRPACTEDKLAPSLGVGTTATFAHMQAAAEKRRSITVTLTTALVWGMLACSSTDEPSPNPPTSGGGPGTAGAPGVAGQSGSAPGGSASTAGAAGAISGTGGQAGQSSQAGAGGAISGAGGSGGSNGGSAGQATAGGGAGGGGGGGSGTAGAGGSGACTKGQTKPSEVILIGDSFIALNHSITNALQDLARQGGVLKANEKYREVAVSGTTLAGNAGNNIPNQYANAVAQSAVKVVLMDGGGNDCLINQNGDAAVAPAQALFQNMAQKGTEKVVYFFYPDPFGNNNLKSCLDGLRPKMKQMCDSLTKPKCYFLDLRPTWTDHRDYAEADGIHPTVAGGTATAAVIWKTMQDNCVAQ
jgi:hypothetical protein